MRLADHLSALRRRAFVGRDAERELFHAALEAETLPYHLLFVFGPGGIGKTTLLAEFAARCADLGIPVTTLDARYVDASPEAFVTSLRSAMGLPAEAAPTDALASPGRRVVMIDTYELLAPLDAWLRDSFLPQVGHNVLFVLAGREGPLPSWRADPGWHALLRPLPLRNLSPHEGRAYLSHRDVPPDQHQAILDFTQGHPLALSLVADGFAHGRATTFQVETAPDVVHVLLQQFLQKVPGPAHRAALEACGMVRSTTESLLAEMLGAPDVHELFEWLRDLSFIESGPLGLYPHDVARKALAADLRWRNPDWYVELHRRARGYYARRLQQTPDPEQQQRILIEYIFLHRDNPVVRPFFDLLRPGSDTEQAGVPDAVLARVDPAKDASAVVAMVERHEGVESARIAAYWLARQPAGMFVVRGLTSDVGEPAGFLALLDLQDVSPDDLAVDPAVRAACGYLHRRAPLRSGERATLFRFWMARDTYQAVSPTQSLIFVNLVRHYLTTPGLAFTFLPCADPDLWQLLFAYADLERAAAADFEVGERRYAVYGHDWRAVPPMAWLDLLATREVAVSSTRAELPLAAEPLVVLGEAEFVAAVRDVLRNHTRPEVLRANPLVRSRLIADRARADPAAPDRVVLLQALVSEAARTLQRSPRERMLYDALDRTYFHAARTQELAAESLNLPFSTYRRHLAGGIARVADLLWQREVGARAD